MAVSALCFFRKFSMAILNFYNIFTIFIFTVCVNGNSVCVSADISSIWNYIKYCSLNLLDSNTENISWINENSTGFLQKSHIDKRIHEHKYVKAL